MLSQLIYYSKDNGSFGLDTLREMVEKASLKNQELGVSGLLFRADGYFLQVLEGQRHRVSQLYHTIASDPRHEEVTLVSFGALPERVFSDWGMRLSLSEDDAGEVERSIILRYSSTREFKPEKMDEEKAHNFLVDIALKARTLNDS